MGNPFIHVELASRDLERSKRFYQGLFDWKLESYDPEYTIVQVGEGTGGGMMPAPAPGVPDRWMPYVLVEDVRASTAKALALGATVDKEVAEVPGMGWFSVIIDPTGAALGLWQAKPR